MFSLSRVNKNGRGHLVGTLFGSNGSNCAMLDFIFRCLSFAVVIASFLEEFFLDPGRISR